jgi:error-prone DNA polymerase
VHDIVQFARSRGILCQGRGSAANSAVCYCLFITEVDPARMRVLFERFISKRAQRAADIDVDFEHERREEVIQYIYAQVRRERAALAATVISYRPAQRGARRGARRWGWTGGSSSAWRSRCPGGTARAISAAFREAGVTRRDSRQVLLFMRWCARSSASRATCRSMSAASSSRAAPVALVPVENAAMAGRTVIQWDKDDLERWAC